jgi:hypothetical protein
MKKLTCAAVLCAALFTSVAHAETLVPQMSAQDIRAATEVEAGHVIVPIMMMIALLLIAGGGAAAGPGPVVLAR